jgi:hypothetical protein
MSDTTNPEFKKLHPEAQRKFLEGAKKMNKNGPGSKLRKFILDSGQIYRDATGGGK